MAREGASWIISDRSGVTLGSYPNLAQGEIALAQLTAGRPYMAQDLALLVFDDEGALVDVIRALS